MVTDSEPGRGPAARRGARDGGRDSPGRERAAACGTSLGEARAVVTEPGLGLGRGPNAE